MPALRPVTIMRDFLVCAGYDETQCVGGRRGGVIVIYFQVVLEETEGHWDEYNELRSESQELFDTRVRRIMW